jgi:putative transposase
LLGTVQDGQVNLSAFGHLCEVFWREIPIHFPKVDLDAFIIMPNHIHGVIGIKDSIDVSKTAVHESFRSPATGSLATIIRSFKSAATRSINDVRETPGSPVWQKGFYEHIVRNERDLIRIRSYIELNPSNWTQDPENVDASG